MEKQGNQDEIGSLGDIWLDDKRIVVLALATELVNEGPIDPWQTRVCLLLRSIYVVFLTFTG